MAAAEGLVRTARQGQAVHFQVHGCGRMMESLPFRRYAERCLRDGATSLCIDLRHCSYLDSTFLGTLLQLQRVSKSHHAGLTLISPSQECTKLLHQIGVHDMFETRAEDELAGTDWQDLASSSADANGFNNNVLEAHEELAGIGGSAGECFKRVAKCLKEDLERRKDA